MKANDQCQALREVAALFLKLGTIAFGGPAAHIAMMEEEVVRRRRWLSHEEFLDLLGATNLIPGPNSTEMAIHIGHRRAGWLGLLVAGICFIVPATVIVIVCAWAYVRFGKLPSAEGMLYGIKPVVIAIVSQALWNLGKTAVKSAFLGLLGLGMAALAFLGVHELALLFLTGFFAALSCVGKFGHAKNVSMALLLPGMGNPILGASTVAAAGAATSAVPFGLLPLFLFFLKVGAVLYGSGYVLLAFLRNDLVERFGWLSEAQLIDAIAVGQFTPGPVFTTATFIGYLLGGVPAGVIATIGIFLPAFVFVAISGPLVPRIRRSPLAGAFLDGVNAASLALMAVVTMQLIRAAVVDSVTIVLSLISLVALMKWRLNSAWLIAGGAAVGLIKAAIAS
ncbi:MAG: chromate efflux transporter [Verrucomicrobiota bacterium]